MAYSKQYKINRKYSVEFTLDITGPVSALNAEWSPTLPPRALVKGKFLEAYRAARDNFLGSLDVKMTVLET
jgi:hypothetical protein